MSGLMGGQGLVVADLCVDHKRQREPLREYVRDAVEHYFAQLGDHPAGGLYELVMREVEAPLLECVLRQTQGNQSRAAELLGINRGTLRKKLKGYGLE
jgi:Fis family transcriptional regulator